MSAEAGIDVIYAEAGRAWRTTLAAAPGLTCGEALARLRAQAPHWPAAAFAPAALAVFGREVSVDTALRSGDRLELLRALPTDPKLARRTRAETTKPR